MSNWHVYAAADPDALNPRNLALPVPGIRGTAVHLVKCGPLVVAASDLDEQVERPTPEELAAHAEVARWFLDHGATVLPFRFGVTAPSQQAIRRLVEINERALVRQLDYLRGRVEASLVAFWEREALRQALLRTPAVRRCVAAARVSPGSEYAARVELGSLAERVVQTWREQCELLARRSLMGHVVELQEGRLIGVRMLINLALLVPETEQETIRAIVARLQESLRGRLRFRLTMPLPAFSFANVALHVPSDIEVAGR